MGTTGGGDDASEEAWQGGELQHPDDVFLHYYVGYFHKWIFHPFVYKNNCMHMYFRKQKTLHLHKGHSKTVGVMRS